MSDVPGQALATLKAQEKEQKLPTCVEKTNFDLEKKTVQIRTVRTYVPLSEKRHILQTVMNFIRVRVIVHGCQGGDGGVDGSVHADAYEIIIGEEKIN